jgi:hypothetical protein
VLVVGEQLLEELLARPQARVDDADLALRELGEPDHVAREVHDLDRLAHVHHEDLAAQAHAARLQHELRASGIDMK